MKRTIFPFLLLILAFAVAAPAADAQRIPPGNSGADQYTEGVPSSDGNRPGNGGGGSAGGGGSKSGGGSDGRGGLSKKVVSDLEKRGATGAEAAAALSPSVPAGAASQSASTAGSGSDSTRGGSDSTRGGSDGSSKGSEGSDGSAGGLSSDGDAADGRSNGVGDVVDTVLTGSSDGLGPGLPILLIVVLLGGIGLALRSRRSNDDSESA